MLESTFNAIPMTIKESLHDGDQVDAFVSKSIVGDLQYLTFTISDIIYAVNQICQNFSNPTLVQLKAVKQILRYLNGILNLGFEISLSKSRISIWI